jgi:hypothetical protein
MQMENKENFTLLDPAMSDTMKYIIYAILVIVVLLLLWLLWERFGGRSSSRRSASPASRKRSVSMFY